MANNIGTKVYDKIVPPTTDDNFGTHDSFYGIGGYREVSTITDRNSIPSERRREGMIVYVISGGTKYILKNGITNSNWEADLSGGIFTGGTIGSIVSTGASYFSTISAVTIYSGSTLLESLFAETVHSHNISDVDTLSTHLGNKANISGATFTGNIYAPIISGGTLYSGSTELGNIIGTVAEQAVLGKYLPISGGTLTGSLSINNVLNFRSLNSGGASKYFEISSTDTGYTGLNLGFKNVTAPTSVLYGIEISAVTSAPTGYNTSGYSIAVGNAISAGYVSQAFGLNINASGAFSIAVGNSVTTTGLQSYALGQYSDSTARFATAIGHYISAAAEKSYVIGIGINSSNKITNNIANSLMFGVNSTLPSFYIGGGAGVGTLGNIGVNLTNPTARLDILSGTTTVAPFRIRKNKSGDKAVLLEGEFQVKTNNRIGFSPNGSNQEELAYVTDLSGYTTSSALTGNYLAKTGGTITGNLEINSNLSATTYYSGSTELSSLFARLSHTHAISDVNTLSTHLNNKADLSGSTFTGNIYAPIISGGTLYSGGTELGGIMKNISNQIILGNYLPISGGTITADLSVLGSTSIYGDFQVFGTTTTISTQVLETSDNNIILNASGNTFSALGGGVYIVSGNSNGSPATLTIDNRGYWSASTAIISTIVTGSSVYGATLYSGSTELSNLFAKAAHIHNISDVTNLQISLDGKSNTGHTHLLTEVSTLSTHLGNKADLSGSTFTGNIYAPVISGGTLYSGGTELGQVISSMVNSLTFTGGTVSNDTNFLGNISASTIYSGNTNLSEIFDRYVPFEYIGSNDFSFESLSGDSSASFVVSKSVPDISFMINGLSGITEVNAAEAGFYVNNFDYHLGLVQHQLSLNKDGFLVSQVQGLNGLFDIRINSKFSSNLSAATYYSGSTLIDSLFARTVHSHNISDVDTLSTHLGNKANISGATFTGNIYAPIISGGTLYSGSTNLSNLFARLSHTHAISDVINLQSSLDVKSNTGHTHLLTEVDTLTTHLVNKANLSGATFTGNIYVPVVSGGTLYSGNTDLGQIISSLVNNSSFTGGTVSNGTNFTGGLSATTIYSGSTDVSNLFAESIHTHTISDVSNLQSSLDGKSNTGHTHLLADVNTLITHLENKVDISGSTFTGNIYAPVISGDTLYSGSTLIDSLFARTSHTHAISDVVNLQSSLNGKSNTGHTHLLTDVNTLSTHLGNKANLSGTTFTGNIYAPVVSGGTLYSGSTLIDSLFARTIHTHSLADVSTLTAHLANKANVSGTTFTGNIYAPVVTGGTIYSGASELGLVIKNSTIVNTKNIYLPFSGGTMTGNLDAGNVTVSARQVFFPNPGTGVTSQILFQKTNDQAGIRVTEFSGDSTLFEFFLADNPEANDIYHWGLADWQNQSGGWKPLKFSGFRNQFVAVNTDFWSNFYLPGTPFYTTNPSTLADRFQPYTSNSYSLIKDSGTGSGILNIDVSAYTISNTHKVFWAEIETGTTTFKWGVGAGIPGYQIISASGVTITGGWQLLESGVSIKLSLTGHSAGDRWAFRVFPTTNLGMGISGVNALSPLHIETNTYPRGSSNIARGTYIRPNLIATGSSNTLIGLDVVPNFVSNSFSGVNQIALRTIGNALISGSTSATTFYSGSTELSQIISAMVNNSAFTGGTVSNGTNFTGGLSATTIYSGSTELSQIISAMVNNSTFSGGTVSNGTNFIGGLSATTIYSGNTDVSNLFARISHTHVISDVTNLQSSLDGKSNTGHTHLLTDVSTLSTHLGNKADLSGSTFTGAVSGTTAAFAGDIMLNGNFGLIGKANNIIRSAVTFNNASNLMTFGSLLTNVNFLGGGTVFAVATSLDIRNNSGLNSTRYTPTTGNWTFGGTVDSGIKVDVQGNMRVTGSTTATTYYSGTTLLDSLFARTSHTHAISDVNTLSAHLGNKADISGVTFTGNIYAPVVSGGTLYSGVTDLSQIISSLVNNSAFSGGTVSNGTNFTGGFSATTIYSGSTDVSNLFARSSHTHAISDVTNLQSSLDGKSNTGHTHLLTDVSTLSTHLGNKADVSGSTFTGNVYVPVVSGGTLYSGSTELSQIISAMVNNSTFSGGTVSNGTNFTGGLSATTIYSGSTELGQVIRSIATASTIQGSYLPLTGGTLTGDLNIDNSIFYFKNSSGQTKTALRIKTGTTNSLDLGAVNDWLTINIYATNINVNSHFRPSASTVFDLGFSALTWRNLYATAIIKPTITTESASNIPLTVKGFASQTSDLTQWTNSSNTVLAKIDSAGNATLKSTTIVGNLTVSGLTGTSGNLRMVEVDDSGFASANSEVVSMFIFDPTTISYLTGSTNWNINGVYTGTAFSASQGQIYIDDNYMYFMKDNSEPIRLVRG